MREKDTLIPADLLPHKPEQNVHGWERAGSVATGVVMVGKGLRKGGLLGLIQIAIGGVALARGITGHSSAKSLLERGRRDLDQIRSKIQHAGDELESLMSSRDNAKVIDGTTLKTPTL